MTGPNEYDFSLPYPDVHQYQYENLSKIGESIFQIKRHREEGILRADDTTDLYQNESSDKNPMKTPQNKLEDLREFEQYTKMIDKFVEEENKKT